MISSHGFAMRSKSGTRVGPTQASQESGLDDLDNQSLRMPLTLKKLNNLNYKAKFTTGKSAPRSDGPGRRNG
jgi:hypothetical protein